MIETKIRKSAAGIFRIVIIILALCLAVGLAAGCDSGGSGGETDGGGGTDNGGGGGISIEPGGTLSNVPETFFYVEGGTDRQTLDLYRITGLTNTNADGVPPSARPALVWFHGGVG